MIMMNKVLSSLVLLAACSDSAHHTPASPDAPLDGAVSDTLPAGAGAIRVNAPYPDASNRITPGATVLFYDENNALLDRQTTGVDGVANGIAVPSARVVVLPPPGISSDDYTWFGVSPGDELTTQRAPTPIPAGAAHHIIVTVSNVYPTATDYELAAVGLSATQHVPQGAPGDVTFDAMLDADAPRFGDVIVKAVSGNYVSFLGAGGVDLGASFLDLTAVSWGGSGTPYTAALTLPLGDVGVTADYKTLEGGRVLWSERNSATQGQGDVVTVSFSSPQGLGDGSALVAHFSGYVYSKSYVLSYNAPPTNATIPVLAPIASNASVVNNTVTWDETGTAPALGIEVTLTGASGAWHVLLPPGATSFTPPPIPLDLAEPPAMDHASVVYAGGNEPGGYQALRTARDAFDLPRWAETPPTLPGVYRFAGN